MGNGLGKICECYGVPCRRPESGGTSGSDEGFGHSFCYVRPETARPSSSKVHHSEETTTFRSISGAALCANTSTPLSTELCAYAASLAAPNSASAFESSTSFQSIPLQPVPRSGVGGTFSGPMGTSTFSGPIERGFLSGPIERGFLSGPLDKNMLSGPLDQLQRSLSHGGRKKKTSLIKALRRAIANVVARTAVVAPIKSGPSASPKENNSTVGSVSVTPPSDGIVVGVELGKDDDDFSFESQNLQWAQGKAGEDRVHVVISEEHGWLFVGIYDGFNGPDAPDYLLSNLYNAVQRELQGLLWDQPPPATAHWEPPSGCLGDADEPEIDAVHQNYGDGSVYDVENLDMNKNTVGRSGRRNCRNRFKRVSKKWEERHRRWKEQFCGAAAGSAATKDSVDHSSVLNALAMALKTTEDDYLDTADRMMTENPELALMGSCVLVALMKGEDVYLMNVGDSRGVLAQTVETDFWDLEMINEETPHDVQFREDGESSDSGRLPEKSSSLSALQLTLDHSTSVEEEVIRIRKEHPDDACAITKDRVKGSLMVTRAFGAGFLKKPKWNDALLEMFQIDYVGTAPYLTCNPSMYHHRLRSGNRFLILSSDGLYQYFTNEEAVAEVESFIRSSPEGDPAQHLVEEVLFRAAKKAGMDFHELLEIPQGDRRRYHDDVSIIIISLEGRIWRSCV